MPMCLSQFGFDFAYMQNAEVKNILLLKEAICTGKINPKFSNQCPNENMKIARYFENKDGRLHSAFLAGH